MSFMKKGMALGLSGLLLAGVMPAAVTAEEDSTFKLDVLHTNDMHAKIENFGKLAGYVDHTRENNENSLYLDAGDIFSGSPVVDLQDGEPMISLLNEIGLDLMTLGNHEFDYGQQVFADRVEQSDFPWIAANMEVVDTEIPIEQPDPYEIFEFDDVSVGVFGLTQSPPATRPAGIVGLEFHDYVETALEYEYLKDEVDILIALNHIGLSADRALAEEVDFFDVIIGGHSHSRMDEAEVVNGTPIIQAGSDARYIGHLTLEFDKDSGEVVLASEHRETVAEIDESLLNEDVDAMVQAYLDETDEILSEVIGYTNTGLNRDDRWEMDVSLGNFWTDAMRNAVGTDIALTNNGGLRANIAPGDITAEHIYTTEPFGNEITEIIMTGEALAGIFEHSYTRSADTFGYQVDLQTSGMEYIIYKNDDDSYADVELFIDGELIDPEQEYSIAINNFMYEGGDGYDFSDSELVQEAAGYVAIAMFQYVDELMDLHGAVDYEPTEGRIQVKHISERDGEEPVELPFTDVSESSWAYDYIASLYADGLINGTTDTTFSPTAETTRGQFAALVTRSLSLERSGEDNPFDDLTGPMTDEILAAYDAGLISGYPNGTFRQNDVITREEMAVMFIRAYEYATGTSADAAASLDFDDADDVSPYAELSMKKAVELGVFEGDGLGNLTPKASSLREQTAKIIFYLNEWK